MPDPRQVPAEVAEYLAEQLGIADASCLKEYGERDGTARTHAGEIQEAGGWRDFAEVRDELSEWLDARAWTTGDGPKSLFDAAGGWLRDWEDILRIIGSIHTGAVRAYDVIRMLSRDRRPTPLGDAIAHYGRISKTLHVLRIADEPGYRRQTKSQANLQEGRHSLARNIFHGRHEQLYQRYQDSMEDQIGALGYVLNARVLFNTRYMDGAVNQLRADGFDVRDEDVARLSPFVRHHVNMLGRYSFQLPELPGGLRPLRGPDAAEEA